jgi:hypothetical protein
MNLPGPQIHFMYSRIIESGTYTKLAKGELEFTLATSGRGY